MTEALQLWKKIAGKGDGSSHDSKPLSSGKHILFVSGNPITNHFILVYLCNDLFYALDGGNPESAVLSESSDLKKENSDERKTDPSVKDLPTSSSNTDSNSKAKAASNSEKAVVILKKKPPVLNDKVLNPEFFQNLEKRGSDDLPVEVVVPRRCLNSSSSNNEEESDASAKDLSERTNPVGNVPNDGFHRAVNNKYHGLEKGNDGNSRQRNYEDFAHERYSERRMNSKELRTKANDTNEGFSRADGQSEVPLSNNRGNLLAIQRQLTQLERQQVHLMNMLQVCFVWPKKSVLVDVLHN
jgi:hypothetical protein